MMEDADADADTEKQSLIGSFVTVSNGNKKKPTHSKWVVFEGVVINNPNEVTAKTKPEEEIDLIDLDFNSLDEASYPLMEVLIRLWPGDATMQLKKLNIKFNQMYPKILSVALKEFFVFVSCLLSAAPVGYGGKKLWSVIAS